VDETVYNETVKKVLALSRHEDANHKEDLNQEQVTPLKGESHVNLNLDDNSSRSEDSGCFECFTKDNQIKVLIQKCNDLHKNLVDQGDELLTTTDRNQFLRNENA